MKQSKGSSGRGRSSKRGGGRRRGGPSRRRGEKPSASTMARMRAGTSEPEYAESIGDSLDIAIRQAVDILGAREDEVDVEVLEEGKRGFLWFSPKRPFRVRVTWQADETHEEIVDQPAPESGSRPTTRAARSDREAPARSHERPRRSRDEATERTPRVAVEPAPERVDRGTAEASDAEEFVAGFFDRVGIQAELKGREDDEGIRLQISGQGAEEFLSDRDGEVQSALQVLTHRVLSRQAERSVPVVLEAGAAGKHHDTDVQAMAKRLAEEVMESSEALETEPLSSPDRRIVHRALADHPRVTTESQGRGLMKRVRIAPR